MNNQHSRQYKPDHFKNAIFQSNDPTFDSWKDYIYAIPCNGRYIVYQPLKKLAFIANHSMVSFSEHILNGENDISDYENNDAYRFLNSAGFFDPVPVPQDLPGYAGIYKPSIAVLLLTTSCNFCCIYCYASAGTGKGNVMSPRTGYSAIDLACNNAKDAGAEYFTLNFHGGGEPTQAWKNFCSLVNYAHTRDLPARISISTNGYLNKKKLSWLLGNIDEISLSCDGTSDVQNLQRPLRSGHNTFDTVFETIRALDKHGKPYGIRLTVTESSIDSLPESISFFCKETGCKSFQAEPAFDHGRAKKNGIALSNQKRFAKSFIAAYDIALSHNRYLFYSGARPASLTSNFCQAPFNALVVSSRGLLTTCYEVFDPAHELGDLFFIGSLNSDRGIEINEVKHRFLLSRIEERRKLCRGCFCYWHCAGDCPAKTISPCGDGHLYTGIRCNINREITKELLLRYIHESGGIWMGKNVKQTVFSPGNNPLNE